MTDPIQWTEKDLKELINLGVPESLTLDYKAPGALVAMNEANKREISKDVSAFANSAGGTIIYGITEKNHLPVLIDGLDPATVTREWLDQVISSRIQRRIDGIRINQVRLKKSGLVVYVVIIPQSEGAPHMASDNRYYKRFEFRSIPMEDYEVRDVANRSKGPLLRIDFTIDQQPKKLIFKDENVVSEPVALHASVMNATSTPAQHAVLRIFKDSRIGNAPPGFTGPQKMQLTTSLTGQFEAESWQLNWGTPGKMPLWEGMNFNLFSTEYRIRLPRKPGNYLMGWQTDSPHMQRQSGGILLQVERDELNIIQIPLVI